MARGRRKLNSTKRKKRRAALFKEQNGLCFWCHEPMTLENPNPHNPPKNFATLDELHARFHGGTQRVGNVVLACVPCNHDRGHQKAPAWALERVAEREAQRKLGGADR